jgi:hypothetical protein
MNDAVAAPRRTRLPGPSPRAQLIDAGVLTALCALALVGLQRTYGSWHYFAVGLVGIGLGLVLAKLAQLLRQPILAISAATIAMFFVLGGPIAVRAKTVAGIVPTVASFHTLFYVGVHGWKELLTTVPTVGNSGPLLALPYLLGLVTGVLGLTVAYRVRAAWAPLAAPVALLAVVILVGTQRPSSLVLQGSVFAGVALAWLAMRHQRLRPVVLSGNRRLWQTGFGAGMVLVAVAGGSLVGPLVPFASAHSRVVLRNYVTPPFDIGQYPSPLAGYRKYTKTGPILGGKQLYDSVLFTVNGLPPNTQVRMAALDSYDGEVWAASPPALLPTSGTGIDAFQRVGQTIDAPPGGQRITATVTIGGWHDVWLPEAGSLTAIHFDGSRGQQEADAFRYNLATATGVVPTGLTTGDQYTFTAILASTALPQDPNPQADGGAIVPATATGFVRGVANSWAAGASGPWAATMAVANHMLSEGRYSDGAGSEDRYPPGHSVFRLTQMTSAAQTVGDDEQYAALLGLMANSAGMPARVVLGAIPEADGSVKGKDVHAWVEVHLTDGRWVPLPNSIFTPTKSPDPVPPPTTTQKATAVVVPPPVASRLPSSSDQPQQSNSTAKAEHKLQHHSTLPGWVVPTVAAVAGTILILLGIYAGLVGLKARRRRVRRSRGSPSTRVAAGWREVLDQARDMGSAIPRYATRREQAVAVGAPPAASLARGADASVFGPTEPTEDEIAAYWADVVSARQAMTAPLSRWRRMLVAANPASLRAEWGGPKPIATVAVPARDGGAR